MDERPRCARCGEVIGMYEPIVRLSDESGRVTSLTAGGRLLAGERLCHRACAEAVDDVADTAAEDRDGLL